MSQIKKAVQDIIKELVTKVHLTKEGISPTYRYNPVFEWTDKLEECIIDHPSNAYTGARLSVVLKAENAPETVVDLMKDISTVIINSNSCYIVPGEKLRNLIRRYDLEHLNKCMKMECKSDNT